MDLSNGAKSIKDCEKKEGGFSRVFVFTMDDNSRVVARLPFPLAGPARLATASEVATIQYCVGTIIPGEDLTSLMLSAIQCNRKRAFRSRKFLTGVTMQQTALEANT